MRASTSVASASRCTDSVRPARLSCTNRCTSPTAMFNSDNETPSWSELCASTSETDARRPPNWTICSLLDERTDTKVCRLRIVENRSVRPSESVRIVSDNSRRAPRTVCPLPSRFSAAVSMNRPRDPCGSSSSGPSASDSRISSVLIWSHSTGEAVRCIGIVAPSSIVGPPE
ncbi:hypothetical protein NJ76_08835 [Rhodococcus sp. IITR03]|nr:hypothetical protein NJ76_08835 [Rhodococcus sp. IITR03]